MLKSVSNSLLFRGLLAVVVGVVALAWPGVTVLALVILFAIYALIAAATEAARAFSSAKAGPVVGHLLLGLVDLGAALLALAWPGPTALVLVLIVGAWAMLGVTPMIGQNDDTEVFSLADAQQLTSFVQANHVGLVAFWSIDRDQVCPAGADYNSCSTVNTANFQFNSIFQAVTK